MTSLALAACESGPFLPAEGEPMIRTDRTEYVAEYVEGSGSYSVYGFTVVARFTNTTGKTVFLGRCYPDTPHPTFDVVLVGAEDAWDASGYLTAWACVGHSQQFRLEPGQRRVDTLYVAGPNGHDGRTGEPYGVVEGSFRLRYDVRYCPEDCRDEVPDDLSRSNAFEVRVVRLTPS